MGGRKSYRQRITRLRVVMFDICMVMMCIFVSVMGSMETKAAPRPDIMGQGVGYATTLYDNSNGLPTSEANAIAQTGDGFVWIGGYSGLIRYDGNDFYRYDASTGISSVVSLFVDSKDRLWIGTNDNGVALFENEEFTFFGKEQGMHSASVRSITEDGEGRIFIATTRGIAYICDDYELHIIEDSRISGEYINEIKRDAQGVIYGNTTSGSVFCIEDCKLTACYTSEELGIENVSCVCPDTKREGYLYLGTEDATVVYGDFQKEMKGHFKTTVFHQKGINALGFVDDEILWVCGENGIGYFVQDNHFVEMTNVPMTNSIDDMMVDYEGNLWFVSSRQGVMKMAESQFTDVNRITDLKNMVVNTTCKYQGDLFIGTDTGLVVLDNNLMQKEHPLVEVLDGVRIRCIKRDSEGNLWLCTYGDKALVCYRGGEDYVVFGPEQGLSSDHVRTMVELSDGTIAVSASGGLNLLRNGRVIKTYGSDEGITNSEVLCICEEEEGRIYIGTDGGGMYLLDGDEVTYMGLEDGLKSEVILRIKKDERRNVYWIITSNSIAYLQNEEIHTITRFPYSNNFDIYFNEYGGICILSSNGIYVVNGDDLLADRELEYTFYDGTCGLPRMVTANSRSELLSDGTLYIAGVSGVTVMNINEIKEDSKDIRLCVPYVEVDNKKIPVEDGMRVEIPSDCKRLTIYGYALTYALNNPRLSYMLEGFDIGPFSESKKEMQPVSYTNLPGGRYVFHLSAIDAMSGTEVNSIKVVIVKQRALYEQDWFRISVFVLLLLLILLCTFIYTRRKTKAFEKKQEENKTFIQQIIHAFAKSIDLKDAYTNGHSFRVAKYTEMISKKMGYGASETEEIYNIALLHDIGKITIPADILNKPGKLTQEEYDVIKQHAENGYNILKEIEMAHGLALGAGYHHERVDGKGYPAGMDGESIPKVAQIIAVADTFDAMNSTRPYREQMPMDQIVAELKRVAGTQLNAEIVEVLLSLIEEGAFDEKEV